MATVEVDVDGAEVLLSTAFRGQVMMEWERVRLAVILMSFAC